MSNRESNLVMGLIVVLAGVGVYYGLLPLVSQYRSLSESLDEQARKLRRDQTILRRAPEIRARARRTRDRLRRLVPGVFPRGGFSEILSGLEKESLRAGLTETNIDKINQVSDQTHRKIRELKVRARFVDVTPRQLMGLLWRFRTRIGRTLLLRYQRVDLHWKDGSRERISAVDLDMVFYGLDTGLSRSRERGAN